MTSLEAFVIKQKELLALEKNAEVEEMRESRKGSSKELENKGLCLNKLKLQSSCTGLFGRTIGTFEATVKGKELPSHSVTSGDIVGLSPVIDIASIKLTGVVTKVTPLTVSVAFEEGDLDQDDGSSFRLVKLANDVTYRRLQSTLDSLKSRECDGKLISLLFGEKSLSSPCVSLPVPMNDGIKTVNFGLDRSQLEALEFALKQPELAIVHGPPGTGKTTTIVEIIYQEVKMGHKVLACAPSNVAVDNLVERLAKYKLNILRLGHPARVLQNIVKYSLDAIVANSEETALVRDVQKEIDDNRRKLSKSKDKGSKYQLKKELGELRKELRVREKNALSRVLRGADVVLGTLTSVHPQGPLKYLPKQHFYTAVIDECSQAIEVSCWAPLLMVEKAIVAGDHHQLPPTICSTEAAKGGLEITLMERLLKDIGSSCVKMLQTQYRMHNHIMQWSSDQFYEGKLVAHESVATHSLLDLPNVRQNEDLDDIGCAMVLIDTAGCDMNEMEDESSKGNQGEAGIAAQYVDAIVSQGLQPRDIAVVAPYNLQVQLLRQLLSEKYPDLEIKSVDGFQGREKEAVVLSLTRSNEKKQVGFLSEHRRINVAVTRAKRHVCVICDSETVSSDKHLNSLIQYMMEHADVRSARHYSTDMDGSLSHDFQTMDSPRPFEDLHINSLLVNQKDNSKNMAKKKKEIQKGKSEAHNTDDDERRKNIFEEKLEEFLSSEAPSLSFPSSLNSFERRCVHELAEKYGLCHESRGEAKERFIIVARQIEDLPAIDEIDTTSKVDKVQTPNKNTLKPKTEHVQAASGNSSKPQTERIQMSGNASRPQSDHVQTSTKKASLKGALPKSSTCKSCGKTVPQQNFQLHEFRCTKNLQKDKDKIENTKKKMDTATAAQPDFDDMLENFTQKDNECGFPQCKTKITLFVEQCRFCKRKFCLSHNIPEVHGCGQHARNHARQQMHQGKEQLPHTDASKRAQLQKKLNKKLSSMEEKRKGKKPS